MKKALIIIGLMILPLAFAVATEAKAVGEFEYFTVSVSPSSAKVGENVTFTMPLKANPPDAYYLEVNITDIKYDKIGDETTKHEDYVLKQTINIHNRGLITEKYEWDTSGSVVGTHSWNIRMTKENHDNIYNVIGTFPLAAAPTPTPGDTGGHGGTPTPGTGGTPTPGSGGTPTPATKYTGSMSISNLGKIVFPTLKVSSISDLLTNIINWFLDLLSVLAVVAIVYSGIMYIMSGGDTTKAENARKNLIWAVIGLVILLLSIVLINFVGSMFK